jgi:hypothetical protein
MSAPDPDQRRTILRECLLLFAVATAVVAALWRLAGVVGFVDAYLPALVAIVFLYVPAAFIWRRGEELSSYGLTARPLGKSLALGLGAPAIVFPLFAAGFVVFYQQVCGVHDADWRWLRDVAPPGLCRRFLGWDGFAHPRLPKDALEALFSQLVVVALPEELFFRGLLLGRLEQALPPSRRVLGGGIGWALVLSALLFALGHVLVDLDPRRFAVFFPGLLFGWMRSATGSIMAGTLCHAAANMTIDTLHRTFFR